jgi:hypothetical protein
LLSSGFSAVNPRSFDGLMWRVIVGDERSFTEGYYYSSSTNRCQSEYTLSLALSIRLINTSKDERSKLPKQKVSQATFKGIGKSIGRRERRRYYVQY